MMEEFYKIIAKEFSADFLSQSKDDLLHYGRDWTREVDPNPSSIVFPRSTKEVSQFLQICSQHKVAVVPSGGRTGLSGGAMATNGEIVLSLERMNKIGKIDELSQTLEVEAGVVTEAVHQFCEPRGLTWPIDFGSKGSSHVGGNISTNAGGIKVLHYGMTRNWVLGVTVVTMSGEIIRLNGALEKNNSGPDLKHLIIGSEGILAVVTEAILKLAPIPKNLKLFFLSVKNRDDVFRLLKFVRSSSVNLFAFECMDKNCFKESIRAHGIKNPFAGEHEQYVLVELQFSSGDAGEAELDSWTEQLLTAGLVEEAVMADSSQCAQEFWKLRESIAEVLAKLAVNHKNDISVPIFHLQQFLLEWEKLFSKKYPNLLLYIYGHFGDGNLHVSALKPADMSMEDFKLRSSEVDKDLFSLVQKYNGSISAEHGLGLLKKPHALYTKSSAELALLRAIKNHMDPYDLLNPGKVI